MPPPGVFPQSFQCNSSGGTSFADWLIEVSDSFTRKEKFDKIYLKTRSHYPILRIRFLIPKIGSRRSDGPISRFRFCGENVGRSFSICSDDSIFGTINSNFDDTILLIQPGDPKSIGHMKNPHQKLPYCFKRPVSDD